MLAKYFSIIRNYVLSVSSQRKYNFYHQNALLDAFRMNSCNIVAGDSFDGDSIASQSRFNAYAYGVQLLLLLGKPEHRRLLGHAGRCARILLWSKFSNIYL